MEKIFKKSFLEGFASTTIDSQYVISALLVTLALALYIFFAYRILTRKTFYSKSFNLSLVGVSLITAAIIVTIQSSIVVSLGMVGALSIVRFRTAIKDPMDLVFLFWSISTGIICGAGFASFAVILALVLTAAIVLLDRIPVAKAPMILVVNANTLDAEQALLAVVQTYAKHFRVKARNVTASTLDLTIELRTAKGADLVKEAMALEGILSVSLLEHDGEVTF